MDSDRVGYNFTTSCLILAEFLYLMKVDTSLHDMELELHVGNYGVFIVTALILGAVMVIVNGVLGSCVIHRVVFWHSRTDSRENEMKEVNKSGKFAMVVTAVAYLLVMALVVASAIW